MAVAELQAETLRTQKEESQLLVIWRRFRKHRLAVFGMTVIVFLGLVAITAQWIRPVDPNLIVLADKNMGLFTTGKGGIFHALGTDELGRDMLSRLMVASQISLTVGFSVVILSEIVGVLVGAVAGYYGGFVDNLLMRFVEFMMTLPSLPLLLVMSAVLRDVHVEFVPRQWWSTIVIIFILTVLGWMGASRLVRGMILSLREQEFTEAARSLGVGDFAIIVRHMIPNSMAPIIVDATLGVGTIIVVESGLSFLGFGIQPPTATWGNMLQNVQKDMWVAPWKAFFPGLCIFLTSLSFNFMGDGLRDALDPRLKM